jgi:hypothetical protein
MKLLCRFLLLVFVFFSIPTFTYAAISYYVSPNGSGSTCSTASPCSVATGMSNASAGSTIIFTAGNYPRTSITKSGSSGSPTTYQAQGTVLTKGFNISGNYNVVNGFEIANTDYSTWGYSNGAGIYNTGSNNILQNNYIHDASLDGMYIDGSNNTVKNNKLFQNELVGIEVHGTNNLIDSNEVWSTVQCHPNIGSTCTSGLDADGMRFWGSGHTFRKNYIHDILLDYTINGKKVQNDPHIDCFQTFSNGGETVGNHIIFEQNHCINYDGSSAFMLEGGSDYLYIHNNIFETATGISANGNGAGGADYLYIFNNIWAGSKTAKGAYPSAGKFENINHIWFENNILYNQYNGAAIFFLGSTSNIIFDYNLIYNSDGSAQHCVEWGSYDSCMPSAGHNKLNVNPLFTNGYHLQSGSPAINAGTTVSGVTNDYDGSSRPQGGAFDIGIFESGSGGRTTNTPTATSGTVPTKTPTPTKKPTTTLTPVASPGINPADADGNGKVDEADYAIWLGNFGKTNISGGRTAGDFNADGKVDGIDYVLWLLHLTP